MDNSTGILETRPTGVMVEGLIVNGSVQSPGGETVRLTVTLTPTEMADIRNDFKIYAIKSIRGRLGLTLLEAKQIADEASLWLNPKPKLKPEPVTAQAQMSEHDLDRYSELLRAREALERKIIRTEDRLAKLQMNSAKLGNDMIQFRRDFGIKEHFAI